MNTLIVLVIILIILSGWNLFGYFDLKKFNRSYRELKDDRYYELKYKTEFITASVLVVIFVGGFFQYKFFDDVNKTADNLTHRLDSLGRVLESKKDSVSNYQVMQSSLVKSQNSLDNRIDSSEKRINIISNKSIVKQDIYIVDRIQFNSPDTCRFYYKDLKNIKGEKLPVFDKPPFLAIFPGGGYLFSIFEKNKDYFIIEAMDGSFAGLSGQVVNSGKYFGIMVSQR